MTPSSSAPRVPTRRRLSEADRRAQIVRATVATVAEVGYEGATLERIAATATVSKGLLSHYFGDKERLMKSTVVTTLEAVRDGIADSLDLTAPVPDIIRQAIHGVAALHRTHRAELTTLNQIIVNLRDANGQQLLTLNDFEETYQAQERLFRLGQQQGTLRDFDTRIMAVSYQGALDAMLGYLDQHPEIDPDAYADTLAGIIIAAVEAPPAR